MVRSSFVQCRSINSICAPLRCIFAQYSTVIEVFVHNVLVVFVHNLLVAFVHNVLVAFVHNVLVAFVQNVL